MAFIRSLRNVSNVYQLTVRSCSYTSSNAIKSVLISQSNDVYTNLALEQWLNKNVNLSKRHIMLYYKNSPCIVLGNSGNPWLDTNTDVIKYGDESKRIPVTRSHAVGKATYQDEGVANFTFYSPQGQIEKDYNISVIARGLFRKFGLNMKRGEKSIFDTKAPENGSDADNGNSYQNCSLFLNLNKTHYSAAIEKKDTEALDGSFKQRHLNISEINPGITADGVLSAVGWEFLRTAAYCLKDGGKALAEKQLGFQMVNPSEKWFPGISEIREKLMSWEWCYGVTPKFTIFQSFPIPLQYLNASTNKYDELRMKLEISCGTIENATLQVPSSLPPTVFMAKANVLAGLKGHKFSADTISCIKSIIEDKGEKSYSKNVRRQAVYA